MALLTVNEITRSGQAVSLVAAAAGGDTFPNTGGEFVIVKNGDASPTTVTLDIKATLDGQPVTDRTVSVAAGAEVAIGPFPTNHYNDANQEVALTYSKITALTVGAFKVGV